MPTKSAAAPAVTPEPLPPVPVIPTKWDATTVAGFVASCVSFLLGVLTSAGVILPSGVGLDAQTITGAAVTIAGIVGGVVTVLSNHSVAKAKIRAGG